MRKVSVLIDSDIYEQLARHAQKSGRSLENCAETALQEYLENAGDAYQTDLCAVDSCERNFFLSLGE